MLTILTALVQLELHLAFAAAPDDPSSQRKPALNAPTNSKQQGSNPPTDR
jgi:hypothetical protein